MGASSNATRPLRPAPAPGPAAAATLPESSVVRWFRPDEDLGGELVLSGAHGAQLAQLVRELEHTDDFLRAGLDPSTRVLFSGPSGTGKTLAARWIGWTLKRPVAVVDVSAAIGSKLGETCSNLAEAFKVAAAQPAILFLDELDAIAARRNACGGDGAAGNELARATTSLLQQLDWLRPSRVVIAATNFPDGLDGALRRRLTTELAFELPDRDARARMLARWFARAPMPAELVDELLEYSEGLSGAELRSRAMARARTALLGKMPPPAPAAPLKKTTEYAQELLRNLDEMGAKR